MGNVLQHIAQQWYKARASKTATHLNFRSMAKKKKKKSKIQSFSRMLSQRLGIEAIIFLAKKFFDDGDWMDFL